MKLKKPSKTVNSNFTLILSTACIASILTGCGGQVVDQRSTSTPSYPQATSITPSSESSSNSTTDSSYTNSSSTENSSTSSGKETINEKALDEEIEDVKNELKTFMSIKNPIERRVLQVEEDNGSVNVYVKNSFNNNDFSSVLKDLKSRYAGGPGDINLVRVKYSKDELSEIAKKINEQKDDLSVKYRVKISSIQLPTRPGDHLTVEVDDLKADYELLSKRFTQLAGGEVRVQQLREDKS